MGSVSTQHGVAARVWGAPVNVTGKVLCSPRTSHRVRREGAGRKEVRPDSSAAPGSSGLHRCRVHSALPCRGPGFLKKMINSLLWEDSGSPAGHPENLGSPSQAGKDPHPACAQNLFLGHPQCQPEGPSRQDPIGPGWS